MGEDLGHTVYRGPEGETTEWGDIQRRIGNFAPLPEVFKPDPWTPGEEEEGVNGGAASGGGAEAGQERMNHKSARELEEMEDEFADDGFLEEYRRKRLEELKAAAAVPRFGAVTPITRDTFMGQVTDPSSRVWVVVFLHRPNCPECETLGKALEELARKNPFTKFVKILGGECIPGYPDRNMPTLLAYRDRDVHTPYHAARTFIGLDAFGGARHMTPEGVALALNECGPVCKGLRGGGEDQDEGGGTYDGGDGGDDAARRRYAEEVVRRMIEDGKELRERKQEAEDDDS